jgi:hypothetical protein
VVDESPLFRRELTIISLTLAAAAKTVVMMVVVVAVIVKYYVPLPPLSTLRFSQLSP